MKGHDPADRARNHLFNQLHDAASARIWSVVEELREAGPGSGSREVLRLSQSEAWSISLERGKYFDGPYFTSPGWPHVQDGGGLRDWVFKIATQIANSVILHADSVLAASDALGIPDLLREHAVRRVMFS